MSQKRSCNGQIFEDLKCKIDKDYKMELQQENIIQNQGKIPLTSKELHCNYCPRRFTEQRDLVRHVSIIHPNDFGKNFNKKDNLDRHTSVINCNYSGGRITEHKNLAHVDDIKSFSCQSCKKVLASKQEMVHHSEKGCFTKRKFESSLKLGELGCVMCDKKFSSIDYLKIHCTEFHPKEPFSFKELNPTIKQIGNVAKNKSNNGYTFCPKCDNHFNSRVQFDLHNCIASVMNEKSKQKLDKSQNKSQITPENIIQSQDKTTPTSKAFQCDYCTRGFTELRNLFWHVRIVHHNIRPFSCEYCKNDFASKQELVRHSKKGCKFENAPKMNISNIKKKQIVKASTQLSLKNFQKIIAVWNQPGHHNDVRPFSCEVCKKAFALKIQLDLHNCTALKGIVIWFVRREEIEPIKRVSSFLFSNTLFVTLT